MERKSNLVLYVKNVNESCRPTIYAQPVGLRLITYKENNLMKLNSKPPTKEQTSNFSFALKLFPGKKGSTRYLSHGWYLRWMIAYENYAEHCLSMSRVYWMSIYTPPSGVHVRVRFSNYITIMNIS